MNEKWIREALALGFTHAYALDPKRLHPREDVRAMCAEDKCRAYGRNWTCPPAIGTLHECAERMEQYGQGILLQTVGRMEKDIDSRAIRRTEEEHNRLLREFSRLLRAEYPDALCLGAGGCRVCKTCSYPDPCHFPEEALSSMEGYGLFVTEVCRRFGAEYHHGPRTITFTACCLFESGKP